MVTVSGPTSDGFDHRAQFKRAGLGIGRDAERSRDAEQRDRCQQRPPAATAGVENLFR
jgi:hypothetical protein